MPKKPASKTKNVTPIKTAAKRRMKKKPAASIAQTGAHKATGMWKILEMKKAQQKQNEHQRDVRPHPGPGGVLQPFNRNTRFTKFAGPRRKVG